MGDKASADGCVGEASLNVDELAFSTSFIVVYLHALPLMVFKLIGECMEPMDIGNHSRVFEQCKGAVDEEARGVGGMEDGVVCIFWTRAADVR